MAIPKGMERIAGQMRGLRAPTRAEVRQWVKTGGLALAFLALAVAGRVAFAAVPNVQPVTALCIMAGIVCGRRWGAAVGVSAALASNVFLGQGMWSLFQMVGWGAAGYGAGLLFARKGASTRSLLIYMYGFAVSLAFGFLMDSQLVLLFGGAMSAEAVLGVYAAGVPFNAAHALGTVAFLVPMLLWQKRNSGKVK